MLVMSYRTKFIEERVYLLCGCRGIRVHDGGEAWLAEDQAFK